MILIAVLLVTMLILLGTVEIQHFDQSEEGKHTQVKLKEHYNPQK